jgi:hypothetical protein
MERLEKLSNGPHTTSGWTTTQEQAPKAAKEASQAGIADSASARPSNVLEVSPLKSQAFQEQIRAILSQHESAVRSSGRQSASPAQPTSASDKADESASSDLPSKRPASAGGPALALPR